MEREYHLYSSEYCTLVQFCIRLYFFVIFSFCVHSKIVSTLSPLEACESIWIRIRIQCIFIRKLYIPMDDNICDCRFHDLLETFQSRLHHTGFEISNKQLSHEQQ